MVDKTESDVLALIDAFQRHLPPDQCQEMKDLTVAGEPGVAYENLCTQLFEFDVQLTERQLDEIRLVGLAMGIDSKYWKRLSSTRS